MRIAALAFAVFVSEQTLADAPPRNVTVVIAGDTNRSFDALLRERVSIAGAELGLERADALDPKIFLTPPTQAPKALAHIWIDATSRERLTVLVLDEGLKRGLIRYVSRGRGDEIAREELGLIVQTVIEALLTGEVIGVTREELNPVPIAHVSPPIEQRPSVAVTQRTPSPPAAVWSVSAGGSYEIDAYARDLAAHGPGMMFDLRRNVEPWVSLGVRFEAQARFPMEVRAPPLEFHIQSWAVRMLGLVAMHAAPNWSAEAILGGALNLEHVVPTSAQAGAALAAPSVRTAFIVRAGVWFARTTPLRVALGLVVDIDTSGATFDVIENGAPRTLFAANVIRPGFIVEIGVR